MRRHIMQQYHRTDRLEEIQAEMIVNLLEKCRHEEVEDWPPLLLMLAEFNPDEIVHGNLRFVESFRTKVKRLPVLGVVKGHNHVSHMLEVGLPGNRTGPRLLAFAHGK